MKIYEVPDFARLVPLFETVVGLIVAGTAVSAWAWFRRRPALALAGLALSMGAGLVTIEDGFRLFEPYRSVARLAAVLRAELRPGDQILVEGRYEQHAGLGFYTGERVRVYRGLAGSPRLRRQRRIRAGLSFPRRNSPGCGAARAGSTCFRRAGRVVAGPGGRRPDRSSGAHGQHLAVRQPRPLISRAAHKPRPGLTAPANLSRWPLCPP